MESVDNSRPKTRGHLNVAETVGAISSEDIVVTLARSTFYDIRD